MFYHIRQMAHPLTSIGKKWRLPVAAELLDPSRPRPFDHPDVRQQSEYLEQILKQGNTLARVTQAVVGPFNTQFWIDLKTKGGKRLARPDEYFRKRWRAAYSNTALESLQLSFRCRIVPPTEDQPEFLLEFANHAGERDVCLREIIESDAFQKSTAPLTIPLGLDVAGNPAMADLAALPHLLITGMTGAGKSIYLDGLILGLIFSHTPEDLRFIMLGELPEFVYFKNLPHLLGPLYYFEDYGMEVLGILKWLETERDQRLALMQSAGHADLERYNFSLQIKGENSLPRIVVIVEHYFAFSGTRDWRTTVPMLKEVDPIFARLVQTAHPAGIHFVITTQTPSHEDMSTILKESFQARLGFAQNHPNFSVMALGTKGAEELVSQGDMLFRKNQRSPYERFQACNISRDEALGVVEYWHRQI